MLEDWHPCAPGLLERPGSWTARARPLRGHFAPKNAANPSQPAKVPTGARRARKPIAALGLLADGYRAALPGGAQRRAVQPRRLWRRAGAGPLNRRTLTAPGDEHAARPIRATALAGHDRPELLQPLHAAGS